MATELPVRNGNGATANQTSDQESFTVKTGLARMLQGGVIMDVVNAEQVSNHQLLSQLCSHRECYKLRYHGLTYHLIGSYSRRSRCSSRHGPRACPSRYPKRWWSSAHVGSKND